MKGRKGHWGVARFRLTCADISGTLRSLTEADITVLDVQIESELTALVSVGAENYVKTVKILRKRGADGKLLKRSGILSILHFVQARAVLIACLLILIGLTVFLPTRIFFWEVSGNERIPSRYIIAQLQQDGVTFGCKRSEIRSEKLKNQLLAQIPQLEWVGVTTSGCVVKISVSESDGNSENKKDMLAGNIVAKCDGVVKSVTVTKGTPVCQTGQAVHKGQVLISGYEDCGFVLKHNGADGEVYASTYRVVEGVCLASGAKRTDLHSVSKKFTLKIGKNLIKLSKDSGISYTGCVKMYEERYVTLPKGFQLPVSMITETYYTYGAADCVASESDFGWISDTVESYVQSQMFGGEILSGQFQLRPEQDVFRFRGAYICTEQIGINRIEEIFSYGKNG